MALCNPLKQISQILSSAQTQRLGFILVCCAHLTELLLSGPWGSGEKVRVKPHEKEQNMVENIW